MAAEHPIRSGPVRTTTEIVPLGKRISWGAIFAGVTMALVTQVLLAMLGAGIGLATLDVPGGDSPDAGTFGTGAGIWWAVSMLIAFFVGGWVAGHMAGLPTASDGRLHGLLAWGLTTLLMLYLLTTTVGSVIGGAFNTLGAAARQGVQAAAAASPDVVGEIAEQARQVARQAGVAIDPAKPDAGLTEQQKAEAAQRARQTADQAADAGAQAGIWGFVALALGAIAAAIGGSAGRPKDLVART